MATTTNFGWETPDDTDLVKDGAAAIRTALGGVDTSFVDLKGGTTGQVLAKASGTDLDFSWVAVDPLTILDAKGDLITATAADTPARLAVGTNGQTLVADSSTATGLKWATASAGALTFISKTAFTAQNTVSINSVFTSTYTNYYIVMDYISTTATDGDTTFRLRASGTDTTANYKCQRIYGSSTTVGASADVFGTDEIYIGTGSTTGSAPAGSSFVLMSPNEAKRTTMQGSVACNNNGANTGMNVVVGFQTDTTQFDGITFLFSQTNTGSIYIYGLAKA
jgi:hypothetical protein